LPRVRIITPFNGTTFLKGTPFTFKGEAFDNHALPDGRLLGNKLTWFDNGVKVGEGGEYTATYSAPGNHNVSLVARNDYGVQATASVSVSVIDPTRIPGEIVILSPRNNQQFNHEQFQPAVVPLTGYATYSDGTAVPGNRLVWTRDGAVGEIGRGSSLTVELNSGVFDATYTLRMTVLSADGLNIGNKAVSVKIVCNACVN
jgi:PKD repeat protein